MSKKTDKERFLAKVEKASSGCWLWTGSIHPRGYGRFAFRGVVDRAHRSSFELFKGEIPKGQVVCHLCDVRHCVNPDHLFLDSQNGNVRDMVAKRRQFRKLDDVDVKMIRFLREVGSNIYDVASWFDVSTSTITRVTRGYLHKAVS